MELGLALASLAELALVLAVEAISAPAALRLGSRTIGLFASSFLMLAVGSSLKLAFFLGAAYPALLPASASAEAVGFLLLALSHVYSVRGQQEERLMIPLMLPYQLFAAYSMAKGVSLYLVLYAAVETTIFCVETRNRASILTSLGLYVIFSSIALSFTAFGAANPMFVEYLEVAGYALLAAPGISSYFSAPRVGGGPS